LIILNVLIIFHYFIPAMRKLATIRRIDKLTPIPNADAIVCAEIGGWKAVVKCHQFQEKQLIIYAEIDSWIPIHLAPYLRKKDEAKYFNGVDGERIQSMKLRGQLSQGLVLDIRDELIFKCLTESGLVNDHTNLEDLINLDVSEALGIQKWEPPTYISTTTTTATQSVEQMRPFPSLIPKTDQERIQNLVEEFALWSTPGSEQCFSWEVTEKLDGSSMTIFVNGDDDGVCSRNFQLVPWPAKDPLIDDSSSLKDDSTSSDPPVVTAETKTSSVKKKKGVEKKKKGPEKSSMYWEVFQRDNFHGKLRQLGRNLALQGELVGPGIQLGTYKLARKEFFCFDIFDMDRREYLTPCERRLLCSQLAIPHVPVLHEDRVFGPSDSVGSLLEEADGHSVLNTDAVREGFVCKANRDERTSFKCISNEFLLKKRQ